METKRVSENISDSSRLTESDINKINNSTTRSDVERPALLSPKSDHKDYNRYKYYSALRTGYKHLTPETKDSFLHPPTHVIDKNLFLLTNPFYEVGMYFNCS